MEWLTDPQAWIALVTLTAIEIVLGIDNIVFISIMAGKLPAAQRERARVIGLSLAMLIRIALLFSLVWMMRLTAPLFTLFGQEFSGRDLILIIGGLFLLWKATMEIHHKLEGPEEIHGAAAATFAGVIIQILLLDIVFSIDSVITAIGLVDQVAVMVVAIVMHAVTNRQVDAVLALILMVGGVVGAQFGARTGQRTRAEQLRLLLGLMVLAVGIRFAFNLVGEPENLYSIRTVEGGP